jgi:4-amino-4-deoxy-L-arabinose transferase-like glycosyltransferase
MPNKYLYPALLALLAAVIFIPFLGHVHLFDWDEINFAEAAREMLILNDYTRVHIRFLPFWEKPPFFFWLQAISMHLFGVNEFAARFPNAVAGIITLPVLFAMGKKLYNEKFGLIWGIVYLGSLFPGFYFQTGIIDPWFNFFIFLSLYFFILSYWKRHNFDGISLKRNHWVYLLLAAVSCGLAVLTKGPVAFLILCLTFFVYWVFKRFKMYVTIPQFLVFAVVMASVTFVWYGIETLKNGPWFITEFIRYNYRLFKQPDAGHGGFFGYHFVVVFFGCFPASIFLLRGLFPQWHDFEYKKNFKTWMLILLWVVLILFTIVKSKIAHYSSLTYFPLTFISALVIHEIIEKRIAFRHTMRWGVRFVASIIGLALFALPFVGMNIEVIQELVKDPFARANMNADPGWTGWESVTGILMIFVAYLGTALMGRKRIMTGMVILFVGTALVLKLAVIFTVKKIESYSQLAAIEYYKEHADKDVYIQPIDHKTYADLFYGKMTQDNNPDVEDYSDYNQRTAWENHLLMGEIDKPVYFISKNKSDRRLREAAEYGVVKIGEKNGFVFYKRMPENE